MKKISLFMCVMCVCNNIYAQVLTQDASGNSTILYNGGVIGINLGESELAVNYNNLYFDKGQTSKKIYGIGLRGKNKDGMAALLSGGSFVASSNISAFYGKRWNNFKSIEYNRLVSETDDLEKQIKELRKKVQAEFLKTLHKEILGNISDAKKSKDLRIQVSELIEADEIWDFVAWFDDKFKETKDAEEKSLYESVSPIINGLRDSFKTKFDLLNDKLTKLNAEIDAKYSSQPAYTKQLIVVRGSLSTTGFSTFKLTDTVNLAKNFDKATFVGKTIELVYNLDKKNWIFGTSIGLNFTSNIDSLTSFNYTLKSIPYISKSKNQQIEAEKAYTGYKDSPTNVKYFTLNFDWVKFYPIGEDNKNILAWNVYLRNNLSYKKLTMPSYSNLGTGLYFLSTKGTFLGGVYLEAFDIFNGTYDTSTDPILKKISFGIVTKLAFLSLLGNAN